MFNKKYKSSLEILDKKINDTLIMFNYYLADAGVTEGLSDQEIYDNTVLRSGKWAKVDEWQARLDALCELRREILKEIGKL